MISTYQEILFYVRLINRIFSFIRYQIDISQTLVEFNFLQLSPQGLLTVHRLTNATVAISKSHPIYLICGYFGLPILNGTTFLWLKNDQVLGSISSEQQSPSFLPESMTISVNPDRKSTTLAILTTTSLNVYGQYKCNISTKL